MRTRLRDGRAGRGCSCELTTVLPPASRMQGGTGTPASLSCREKVVHAPSSTYRNLPSGSDLHTVACHTTSSHSGQQQADSLQGVPVCYRELAGAVLAILPFEAAARPLHHHRLLGCAGVEAHTVLLGVNDLHKGL